MLGVVILQAGILLRVCIEDVCADGVSEPNQLLTVVTELPTQLFDVLAKRYMNILVSRLGRLLEIGAQRADL